MKRQDFERIEGYMKQFPSDGVHDALHVYRVLYLALEIARAEKNLQIEILIAACLLHDIGREKEANDPSVSHSEVGAEMAEEFLCEQGWNEKSAERVREAIASHSYSKRNPPASIEAKILFDADKLDLSGAIGVARAMRFGYSINEPLYLIDEDGVPTAASPDDAPSLLREYNRKLKDLYQVFYTKGAREIAAKRQKTMDFYFEQLKEEIEETLKTGRELLRESLK